ncbi:uncharacterized protein CLUP02_09096 [Colletotrichum lupini]|uniref:Ankyrin repeat protein n=1 Tax=Colletotrichum lupini TaxID=145971 RepID=A0A9Q8WI31_9PEZI|nr:uncharacterized protein CLUP02_09096 [Colletotrichum lupini]UQC83602.1 hypothetical protein CLUP02_09096 [Colletotrichum lupini]
MSPSHGRHLTGGVTLENSANGGGEIFSFLFARFRSFTGFVFWCEASSTMPTDHNQNFRIRGLPREYETRADVRVLVKEVLSLKPNASVIVHSLAICPVKRDSRVATLRFNPLPDYFSDRSRNEWVVSLTNEDDSDFKAPLIFDTHFSGFTPLQRTVDESCNVDSFQNLSDLGRALQIDLRGIQTIVRMKEEIHEAHASILDSISGFIFFGVPHQGLAIESLVPLVKNQPNRSLLESLNRNSALLQRLDKEFNNVISARRPSIVSFYETEKSPTAVETVSGHFLFENKSTGTAMFIPQRTPVVGFSRIRNTKLGRIVREAFSGSKETLEPATLMDDIEREKALVKICFSSRHYPILGCETMSTIHVEEKNDEDIRLVVRERLKEIQPVAKRQQLENEILMKAHGGFQWAILIVAAILHGSAIGTSVESLHKRLTTIPEALDGLYASILSGVDPIEQYQMTKLFQWILFAARPLSSHELREALAVDYKDKNCTTISQLRHHDNWTDTATQFERIVTHISKGLVEFRTREIWEQHDPDGEDWDREAQFVHQSVADYVLGKFIKPTRHDSSCQSPIGAGHFEISRECREDMALLLLDRSIEWQLQEEAVNIEVAQDSSQGRPRNYLSHLNMKNGDGETPLTVAVTVKAGEVIFKLIEAGADLELFGHQMGLVLYAIRHRDKKLISILLEKGVELDGVIFYAVKRLSEDSDLDGLEILSKLLEAGGNTRRSTYFDWVFDDEDEIEDEFAYDNEAMILASRRGHTAIVSLLLSHGALADIRDDFGDFPLLIAASNGHKETVEVLLDHAPHIVEMEDESGLTAFDVAVSEGHFEWAIRLLPQHNELVAPYIAFDMAVKAGEWELVSAMLCAEIEKTDLGNEGDRIGRTPFLWAI